MKICTLFITTFFLAAGTLVYAKSGIGHVLEDCSLHRRSLDKMLSSLKFVPRYPISLFTAKKEVEYWLFTRSTPKVGVQVHLNNSQDLEKGKFRTGREVLVVAHGWISSFKANWIRRLIDVYLAKHDANVIAIDWRVCTSTIFYSSSVACTNSIAPDVATFLRFLMKNGITKENLHLIGHSLGAHLVSCTANNLNFVYRITALDPAGPLFGFRKHLFNVSDAEWIDVIHTNVAQLGHTRALGTQDFFVNGGMRQPMCSHVLAILDIICDHVAATKYFIESIKHPKQYKAFRCKNEEDAKSGTACKRSKTYMGLDADRGKPGLYYVPIGVSPHVNFDIRLVF